MKKLILALGLFSLCSLSAYELNFAKKFSLDVSPDILSSFISVNYENKDESVINDKLDEFNNFFKDHDEVIKKNGRFNLNPRYRYVKGKQIFLGYRGNLSYNIESKNAKVFNTFISELIALKKDINIKTLKLSIGNISWKISQKQKVSSIDNLRKEAISWIKEYKLTISESCSIKKINIGNSTNFNYQPRYNSRSLQVMSSTPKDISPINNNKKVSLNVNYKLDCR